MKEQINRHRGANLGVLALLFAIFFITGLSFVISLNAKPPYYPGPWESIQTIQNYFAHQQYDVLLCGFFQFIAAIPLGLFTASITSRLLFLGNKSIGPFISLFGGFFTVISLALSALLLWVVAFPGIADNQAVLQALYYIVYAVGGVGYSVPLGLLIAGISVSGAFMKILPKWMVVFGIILGIFGELSCLSLLFPKLLPLIPLTRFPGFIWLIIAGFKLPRSSSAMSTPTITT